MTAPPDALSDDIRLLGKMLGDVIADQAGAETLDLVESIRRVSVGPNGQSELPALLDSLALADGLHVIRAFSYFSLLANIGKSATCLPVARNYA